MHRPAAVLTLLLAAGCATTRALPPPAPAPAASLASDLDAIFTTPPFDTAVWSVRIERLSSGEVLYDRTPRTLVMPASNMKIVTMAAAAETLGWDYRFETRLVAEGEIRDGTLHGDLRVIGGGDPSINPVDFESSALFLDWADALRAAGITRVTGRIIGDDNAFDDEMLGAGWSWDYLEAGYAAPVSALQYSEGVAVLRIRPAAREGEPATVIVSPPGHGLDVRAEVRTEAPTVNASVSIDRPLGSRTVRVAGRVPAGGRQIIRTVSSHNPTLYFVEGLRRALNAAGIRVDGPAVDIDDASGYTPAAQPRAIAIHKSGTLAELGAYFMKVSQNMYGETFLKTMGRASGKGPGSLATGRAVVRSLLEKWGIPPGTYAISDGSGLSRYNEISAWLITKILRRMYEDDRHRGWFMATLPVAGHDGTLRSRMAGTVLERSVQAKTGTIANARALSGFLTAPSGERVIFSIVANNFLRPSSEVDALVERALTRVLRELSPVMPAPQAQVPR
jgi:serine-type D-Ala-D-Ala carboxypeptidase/endopeptidase (penicillin-binding protein 4)